MKYAIDKVHPKMIEFGNNLSALLADRHMSQGDLAEQIGVDRGAISKYVTCTVAPGFRKLCAICDALGVTPNDLLGY